jgi:DNA-binding Xre family transcriptional regulator
MKQRIKNRFTELLGKKVREDGRRISQREVADTLNIAKGTIDRIALNKTTRYDEHVILALCNFLECDIGELLYIEEVPDEEGQQKTLLAIA